MDKPKRFEQARRAGQGWLRRQGMESLGIAGLLALIATAGLLIANLLRSLCEGDCQNWLSIPAALLETLGIILILAAFAAAGHWIGGLTHRTWLERMQLQREGLRLEDDPDPALQRRLDGWLAQDSPVAAIQEKGRRHFWAALPIVVVAPVMIPGAGQNFLEPGQVGAYALPFLALAAITAIAALVRGLLLVGSVRKMVRPRENATAQ